MPRKGLHEVVADEHSVRVIHAVQKPIDPFLPLLIFSLEEGFETLAHEFPKAIFDFDTQFVASVLANKHTIGLVPVHEYAVDLQG